MAEEISADIIILGSPRDGPALRCAFGSVASGLVSASNRPLALTPRGRFLGGAVTAELLA